MISLTDAQLDVIIRMAVDLQQEKRDAYLQRIVALLQQRAGRHTVADVITAAEISLRSLMVQHSAA